MIWCNVIRKRTCSRWISTLTIGWEKKSQQQNVAFCDLEANFVTKQSEKIIIDVSLPKRWTFGYPNARSNLIYVEKCCSKTRVSNSKISKGHILKKNVPRDAVYWKNDCAGCKAPEKLWKKSNLFKIYNIVSFWDVRGPHKYIWRAACLRPLLYRFNNLSELSTENLYREKTKQLSSIYSIVSEGYAYKQKNPPHLPN